MTNLEKYNEVFIRSFGVSEHELEELAYQSIEAWDSVGQVELVVELEKAFDVEMNPEDIIDFSSYKKGIELLKKYDIVM
ncbi:MAG: acyl carrier protein [Lachnospiraceae bacterium]|nr:acyl carrier protein [Lachnospiraceae bacterium]